MVLGGTCKIGVLGGIGPEATGEFYNKLITELQVRELINNNQDFPQIIINSIPAPELIGNKISEKDLENYISGLRELHNFEVDFIVMVCNTIHLFHDKFQKRINTTILDLKEEIKKFLIKNNIQKVLVIGTPLTIKGGLYEFQEISSFKPNEKELETLSKAIFNFNKGFKKEEQIKITKKICEKYLEKGAKKIILGCTEFAVMLGKKNLPNINTIDLLVDATIKKFILTKAKGDIL
ncbi:MAG: aspartate/glutamate racemase family protein [Nanoarchaeota archaeon]|nr:aspartate/glutamate racemase family protein [DPANN group archaeon]MBL7116308.1 aspartate/glutamate racemase family protein [Nanoarchaeota archaeon]